MLIRKSALAGSWYPGTSEEILAQFASWKIEQPRCGIAVVGPHAGWVFSGRLSAIAMASLLEADTVCIIGGHLRPGSPLLYAQENGFSTPLGTIEADTEVSDWCIRSFLELPHTASQKQSRTALPDTFKDNSVEVVLPLVKLLFPKSRLIWLRIPSDGTACELGTILGNIPDFFGKSIAIYASTDLTHYGPDYNFVPHGSGRVAQDWVTNVNDKAFMDAVISLDTQRILGVANNSKSACSAGAVATAVTYALSRCSTLSARALGYSTSLEAHKNHSFVGYTAITLGEAQEVSGKHHQ